MNLLLLFAEDAIGPDTYAVDGARAAHVEGVLGARVGEALRVGLLRGGVGQGVIVERSEARVVVRVAEWGPEPPRPGVSLIVGLPRPKTLAKLLPEVATFGVEALTLLRTWKVEKAFLGSELLRPEGYGALFEQGLMQGRRTTPPTLHLEPLFRPFAEDRAPAVAAAHDVAVVAHPEAAVHVAELGPRLRRAGSVVAAIGPEGGFTAYEVEALARAGFVPVRIGPSPLRVESAVVAVLAQLEVLRALVPAEIRSAGELP